jgi:hypothetical protein
MTDLPKPGTPLKLHDGTVIDTMKGAVIKPVGEIVARIPTNTELQRKEVEKSKKLADLPDIPARMNVVSAVLAYTMFGLTDDDIASALNIYVQQVDNIRKTPAYTSMQTSVTESLVKSDQGHVLSLVHDNAVIAATRVAELMDCGDPKVELAASKDILDRAGFGAKSNEQRTQEAAQSSIRITIIKQESNESTPIVDLTREDYEDAAFS